MKFVSYLTFDGRCREAFDFYAKTLGGKIVAMISHGETPAAEQVPADWHDKIINAHLVVGDQELMGCDAPPQFFNGHEGFSVSIQLDEESEAERIFTALAEGGAVTMPLAPTFWAKRFGMLRDRFGTPWMINCAAAG
jgi:PhnB protein